MVRAKLAYCGTTTVHSARQCLRKQARIAPRQVIFQFAMSDVCDEVLVREADTAILKYLEKRFFKLREEAAKHYRESKLKYEESEAMVEEINEYRRSLKQPMLEIKRKRKSLNEEDSTSKRLRFDSE